MNDIPNEVKLAIIEQEIAGVQQQIYRMSIAVEARKIAGYTEQETAPLMTELERLVKMRDAFNAKIALLTAKE